MGNQNRSGTYDTPTGRTLSVADMKHVGGVDEAITMALDDTEYSAEIARGEIGTIFRLSDGAVAWRYSFTQGVVAGGGGMPAPANFSLLLSGPNKGQTLYFAHTAGASQKMNHGGEVPE